MGVGERTEGFSGDVTHLLAAILDVFIGLQQKQGSRFELCCFQELEKRFLCCVELAPNLYDQTLFGVCCRNDDERLEMTYKIKSTQDNKSMGNTREHRGN